MTRDPEAEIAWLRGEVYGRDASIPVHPRVVKKLMQLLDSGI
jgi:hypothetical protein